ncbi:MAG: Ltp family lipoprotein, partial [Eggerthellaceae bacterium]|nr:Ltp family lipoprotein [Eggerthellaceae bacterium]
LILACVLSLKVLSGCSSIAFDTVEDDGSTDAIETVESAKENTNEDTVNDISGLDPENIPDSYYEALDEAQQLSDEQHLSRQAIFDELISEDGGSYSDEAAEYAVENVDADWEYNALATALEYINEDGMPQAQVFSHLISSYGGKFTEDEARYAMNHL